MTFTIQTSNKNIPPPKRGVRIRNLKIIYDFMKSKANNDGILTVAQSEIVQETGLSLRTVKRHTAALRSFDHIEVIHTTREGTTYKLKI